MTDETPTEREAKRKRREDLGEAVFGWIIGTAMLSIVSAFVVSMVWGDRYIWLGFIGSALLVGAFILGIRLGAAPRRRP